MILTLGDSVCWGQGLAEPHKFDSILASALGKPLTRVAHSGAVIGTSSDSSIQSDAGEIPLSSPSIWQQVLAPHDWSQIDLVLLDGGINDIGVSRILNPVISSDRIAQWVIQFCNTAMSGLLQAIASRLVRPGARIAVLGYYPILSPLSLGTDLQMKALLEIHGLASTSVLAPANFSIADILPAIVQNCMTFWHNSDLALQAAVDAANQALGSPVCLFVESGFTEQNSLWAPNPLLWQLTGLFLPEDEVSGPRGAICQTLYGDLVHLPQLVECIRASTGHPRIEGAALIANQLQAAL